MAAPEKPIVYVAEIQPPGKRIKVPIPADATVEDFLNAVKKRAKYAVKGMDPETLESVREDEVELCPVDTVAYLVDPGAVLIVCSSDWVGALIPPTKGEENMSRPEMGINRSDPTKSAPTKEENSSRPQLKANRSGPPQSEINVDVKMSSVDPLGEDVPETMDLEDQNNETNNDLLNTDGSLRQDLEQKLTEVFHSYSHDGAEYLDAREISGLVKKIWNWADEECLETATNLIAEFGNVKEDHINVREFLNIYQTSARENPMQCRRELARLGLIENFCVKYQTLERCMNEKPREIRVPFDTTMRDFKCLIATNEEISNFKLPQQRIARKKITPTCFCEQTKKIFIEDKYLICRKASDSSTPCECPRKHLTTEQLNDECSFCTNSFKQSCGKCEDPEKCYLIESGCGHLFHAHCFAGWSLSKNCPVCRAVWKWEAVDEISSNQFVLPVHAISSETGEKETYYLNVTPQTKAQELFQRLEVMGAANPWQNHLRIHKSGGARSSSTSNLYASLRKTVDYTSSSVSSSISPTSRTLAQLKIVRGTSLSLCSPTAHQFTIEVTVSVQNGADYLFSVNSNTNVSDIENRVAKKMKLVKTYAVLSHEGKELESHLCLTEITFTKTKLKLTCELNKVSLDIDFFTCSHKLPGNSNSLLSDVLQAGDVVYVNRRFCNPKMTEFVQITNIDQLCVKDLSWIPTQCDQSDKGMSQFLCCIYKACHLKDDPGKRLTGHLRKLLIDWPPFANVFNLVIKKMFHQLHIQEKSLLANTMFYLIENIVSNIQLNPHRSQFFENVRIILATVEQTAIHTDTNFEKFDTIPLTCEKSQSILEDPVAYEGNYYERGNLLSDETINKSNIEECPNISILLESYPNTRQVNVWKKQNVRYHEPEEHRSIFEYSWTGFKKNASKNKSFPFVSPVSIGVAIPPSITLNENGLFAIFKGHSAGKAVSITDKDLYDPITGQTTSRDPQSYAANLPNIEDERDILEGIYVVLDTSQSMCGHSGFTDQKDLKIDQIVRVSGLKNQKRYNGSDGIIMGKRTNGRYTIQLFDTDNIISVRPSNLTVVRGHEKEEGWDNRPIENESEEEKLRCLRKLSSDPLLKHYQEAVKSALTCNGDVIVLAQKTVLEEICAMYNRRDTVDEDCSQMSRYITKYQDEFGRVLISSMDNLDSEQDDDDDDDEVELHMKNHDEIPNEFMCPITRSLFEDPVVADDGCTYERHAIRTWFQSKSTSPMYGTRIRTHLVRNQNLKTQIHDWKEEKDRKRKEQKMERKNPAVSQHSWQLFVRCTGQLHTLIVKPTSTVKDVLVQISKRTHIPSSHMMLRMITGRVIRDNSLTLRTCGLHNESTVTIRLRVNKTVSKDPVTMKISLEKIWGCDSLILLAHEDESFEGILWKIWCSVLRKWDHFERYYRPSKCDLWKDMTDCGDGYVSGSKMSLEKQMQSQFHGKDWDSLNREMKLGCKKKHLAKGKRNYMTRIDCVKQLFQAFINRSQGYHYANHIGLITFGSSVNIKCKISPFYETFRNALESAHPNGETKLFDAMGKAIDELLEWKKKHPKAKLRLLVLSDGADTNSTTNANTLGSRIQSNQVTVDAVCIGDETDRKLHALAKCSGGYIFYPETLVTALKLNELETFLSQEERPPKANVNKISRSRGLDQFEIMKADQCNDDVVPPRKVNASSYQSVTGLETIVNSSNHSKNVEGLPRQKRIMRELKLLHRQPHPMVDVFPCEDDINALRILMQGPAQTPYVGGIWLIDITFGPDYPDTAPELRFRTPIKHCNINSYGRVCHSIFGRGWSADMSLKTIIECVYGLLLTPEHDDPLDSALASSYYDDLGTYENVISTHTAKHAMKRSREEWNDLLLAETTDEEKADLALKRDLIRRQEKPYEQERSDYCFHCRKKARLKRCETCHLALFCSRTYKRCSTQSEHVCFDC